MSVGVNHSGVELLVPQELLDGGDRATCIEQLGGGGVPETVRVDPARNRGELTHPQPLYLLRLDLPERSGQAIQYHEP